ncbi:hypothetical protein RVM25_36845, partial [Enterobacter hormaechei subsp. xiangfangensis]
MSVSSPKHLRRCKVKPHGSLVSVSSTHRCAYTPETDTASGGIQNNAIALITSTLAQVDQRVRLSAQYGDSKAGIDRIDNVMASDREATARSLLS